MDSRWKLKTTPERSLLMSRVRQSGTAPELLVRKLVHSCGCGFRTKAKDLPGTPDLVNRKLKWAIFVHGCFWHAHQDCVLWKIPKANDRYWQQKFAENRARDKRKIEELKKLGYSVLVIWQCDLRNEKKLRGKISKLVGKPSN